MRYPPLLIALFIAMLLKPFAELTGASILPGSFFLMLVFGTLIYAFRHIRSLALCLTVLGVATVTSVFLPSAACSDPGDSQPRVELHRHDRRDGRNVFRGASSAPCFVRSGNGRSFSCTWSSDWPGRFFTIQSTCPHQAQFSFPRKPRL
jgi:hypothetical protein